jgi:hypothetical protein
MTTTEAAVFSLIVIVSYDLAGRVWDFVFAKVQRRKP